MNVSIIVPAYNEVDNLPGLLADIEQFVLSAPCEVEVIVVDDASNDGTPQLLAEEIGRRPWLRMIESESNGGMGAALKIGSTKANFPIVAWVMGDRSDRLSDILEMRKRIMDGADLVVASRAATGGSYGELIGLKAFGSRLFSSFARIMLRLPVHDTSNAFRAFRRDLLQEIVLLKNDFAISPELVIKAAAKGKKVMEVPTVYSFRRQGMSNFVAVRMGLIYGWLVLRAFFARLGGS